MSRIGRNPIPLPLGVSVSIHPSEVATRGPLGELRQQLSPEMHIELKDNTIVVNRPSDQRRHRALHGLTRSLIANMVTGVSQGFRKDLEIVGVGYRARKDGERLVIQVGYSHLVEISPPQGIRFEVAGTRIGVIGIDKQLVGQVAANIRAIRSPEPYKGKGIRYIGEVVRRKAGKASRIGKKR